MKLEFMAKSVWICFMFATTLSAQESEENNVKVFLPELTSNTRQVCYNKTNMFCPESKFEIETRILSCEFKCTQGTFYRCKNDKGGKGIIEFCAKSEECNIGQMNKVYFDDKHQQVVVEKSICPDRFYQPFRVNCYTACTYKHEDMDLIAGLGIKVLYHGNNTHAGLGYCDVDNGFVSSDSSMYITLAENEVISCDKLDNFKKYCPTEQRLLPDRSCGTICRNGYVVDKWNRFQCSKQSGDNSTTVILQTTAHPGLSNISSKRNPNHIPRKPTSTASPPQNASHSINTPVIVIVVLLIVAVVVISILVWCKCRGKQCDCRKRKRGRGQNVRNRNGFSRCVRNKFEAERMEITIHYDGNKETISTRKSSSDTGISISNISEVEPDHHSIESGYLTVQRDESFPKQVMNKLKSVGNSDPVDVDPEQTIPLKRIS